MSLSRRRFLRNSAAGAAGAALWTPPAGAVGRRRVAPSDRIVIGAIGLNNMGFTNTRNLLRQPEVECAALCDVDENLLEPRAGEVEERRGRKPALYTDYREMLDDDDIDAVVIGTPDHWHCLQMVDACAAGKDVYVEKPLGHSIHECQVMTAAARYYGRIVQCGQWQRSGLHWIEAIEFLHGGALGRVRTVRAWAYLNSMRQVTPAPDGEAPEGVDYDRWLGPAPKRPFNPNRFHHNWLWFWDYADGLMSAFAVHLIDIVLWGMKAEAPRSVVAGGGKFGWPDDDRETPDTMTAIYEFDDFVMIWEHAAGIGLGPFQRSHGVAFVGDNGTLMVHRDGWEIHPEEKPPEPGTRRGEEPVAYKMPEQPPVVAVRGERGLTLHTENFTDCMRSRRQPVCNTEVAARAAVNTHLGNIAFRTGGKVVWDAKKQRFEGGADSPANAMLRAPYRAPWTLPKI